MRIFKPASLGKGVRLASTASYLPERIVTNAELIAEGGPLTEEEILRLSGIRTRHRAAPGQAASDLAIEAASRALRRAGLPVAEVDRLILATVSGDHPSPSTACIVQHALKLGQVPAYDLAATCSGFVYALEAAARAICTGDRAVLTLASEVRSRFVNPTDRATFALFGDGAGAAVVVPGPVDEGLIAVGLAADGRGAQSVVVPAGGSREPASPRSLAEHRHTVHMVDGPEVYFHAVEGMLGAGGELLSSCGLTWADLACVVPHQANLRLLDRIARLAPLTPDQLFVHVERVGNVSGASTAIALDEALRTRHFKPGDWVLLLAAGAGYTVGAALLRLGKADLPGEGEGR
jgi:3-oxoacyl-[acyl-carrier-protein] synthase III